MATTIAEQQAQSQALIESNAKLRELAVSLGRVFNLHKRCTNCRAWGPNVPHNPQKEGCTLAQGAMPPPMVIANGCNAWVEDTNLPF